MYLFLLGNKRILLLLPPGETNERRIVNSSGSPLQDEGPVPDCSITLESNEADNDHGRDSPHGEVPVRISSASTKGFHLSDMEIQLLFKVG